jgi:site-specific DNA-methyltransferase (adenine-specific)
VLFSAGSPELAPGYFRFPRASCPAAADDDTPMSIELPTADEPVKVVCGTALQAMRGLSDGCVDAVITDPPYGTAGYRRTAAGQGSRFASASKREAWDQWDAAWLYEAFRVCSGPVLLFVPDRELPAVLKDATFEGRDWRLLHWCKPDPMPHQGGQPAFGTETIVAFGPLQRVGGRNWIEASAPRANRDAEHAGHPYQKPVRVMRWLSRIGCAEGATILDPFAGSGSTGVGAMLEGRRALLIEQDPTYCDIARRRIAEAMCETPGTLFAPESPSLFA